jgi:hypothetical protein
MRAVVILDVLDRGQDIELRFLAAVLEPVFLAIALEFSEEGEALAARLFELE